LEVGEPWDFWLGADGASDWGLVILHGGRIIVPPSTVSGNGAVCVHFAAGCVVSISEEI
jgi:hypothetical protein